MKCRPIEIEAFLAAFDGDISADEYLDMVGEPRRPWPTVKEHGDFCDLCHQYFYNTNARNRHMRTHIKAL